MKCVRRNTHGPVRATGTRALLATLRRDGRQQSGLDARLVPPDKATAYRVAALVAEELGWPVGGWKIAAMKEEMQKALRTDRRSTVASSPRS